MASDKVSKEIEAIEVDLLLEGIRRRYGYNLGDYSDEFVRGLVRRRQTAEKTESVTHLLERLLRSPESMEEMLRDMGGPARAMFSPSGLFQVIRKKVLPMLRTYPSVRVWYMGCGEGEEVYSLAILLEEGLSKRFRIYATDLHESFLERAQRASYPGTSLKTFERNYASSGGTGPFERYIKSMNGKLILTPDLRRHVVFAAHNPATDAAFNDFHFILCRDGFAVYRDALRLRALQLMDDSLLRFGYMALVGGRPTSEFVVPEGYKRIDTRYALYRKING